MPEVSDVKLSGRACLLYLRRAVVLIARVRIVSDGTSAGTFVLDAETGIKLLGVLSVALDIQACGPMMAKVTQYFRVAELDVTADCETVLDGDGQCTGSGTVDSLQTQGF